MPGHTSYNKCVRAVGRCKGGGYAESRLALNTLVNSCGKGRANASKGIGFLLLNAELHLSPLPLSCVISSTGLNQTLLDVEKAPFPGYSFPKVSDLACACGGEKPKGDLKVKSCTFSFLKTK